MNYKNTRAILVLFLIAISLTSSGCFLFLLGAGAAGGYAVIADDEIEGFVDTSYDRVWNDSVRVMRQNGIVTVEDKTHGVIDAEVGKSKVELQVARINNQTMRLRVKSRKMNNMFPDVKTAQNLYTQIVQK